MKYIKFFVTAFRQRRERRHFQALLFLRLQVDELTAEEKLAEKLRVKKLQEESDLELTKDAFGEARLRFTHLGFFWRERFIHALLFQASAVLQTTSQVLTPCVHLPKKTSTSLKSC